MNFYLIILSLLISFFTTSKKHQIHYPHNIESERLNTQINQTKTFIRQNPDYNNKTAFFIDMKIKSGKKRFFIYDLINDKIIDQGLVAHGSGSETEVPGNLQFSNLPDSKCTSLGTYRIGKHYTGIFGKAYKLHGLDKTNNNAFKRAIVLHHYSAVPGDEQDHSIINSHGCPMINKDFFKRTEKILDQSKSSISLRIYY